MVVAIDYPEYLCDGCFSLENAVVVPNFYFDGNFVAADVEGWMWLGLSGNQTVCSVQLVLCEYHEQQCYPSIAVNLNLDWFQHAIVVIRGFVGFQ